MIPLQDIDTPPRQSFPFVNTGLIIINVLVFLREVTLPSAEASNCFVGAFSYDPAFFTNHVTVPAAYVGCAGTGYPLLPAWGTLLTAMFLHSGIAHIGFNMLYLFIFGDNVEDRFGHIGYLVFYLFCGALASLAQTFVATTADIPNLGASGAIAGVLGAYLILFPHARVRTLIFLGFFGFFTTLSAILVIVGWFALQLFDGFLTLNTAGATMQGGTAYFAHIGGFVTGLVIALALKRYLPSDLPTYMRSNSSYYR